MRLQPCSAEEWERRGEDTSFLGVTGEAILNGSLERPQARNCSCLGPGAAGGAKSIYSISGPGLLRCVSPLAVLPSALWRPSP